MGITLDNEIRIDSSFYRLLHSGNSLLLTVNQPWNSDNLGALFGLASYLKIAGKECFMIHETPVPANLFFLIPEGFQNQISHKDGADALDGIDVVVTIGSMPETSREFFAPEAIPHLIISYNARTEVSDHYLATFSTSLSEMIYQLFLHDQIPLNQQTALALYSGIVFATSSFRSPKTRRQTHAAAAAMLPQIGINTNDIFRNLFEKKSLSQLYLFRALVASSRLLFQEKAVISHIDSAALTGMKASLSDLLELLEFPFVSSTIRISAIVYYQNEQQMCRIYLLCKKPFNAYQILEEWIPTGDSYRAEISIASHSENALMLLETIIGQQIHSQS